MGGLRKITYDLYSFPLIIFKPNLKICRCKNSQSEVEWRGVSVWIGIKKYELS